MTGRSVGAGVRVELPGTPDEGVSLLLGYAQGQSARPVVGGVIIEDRDHDLVKPVRATLLQGHAKDGGIEIAIARRALKVKLRDHLVVTTPLLDGLRAPCRSGGLAGLPPRECGRCGSDDSGDSRDPRSGHHGGMVGAGTDNRESSGSGGVHFSSVGMRIMFTGWLVMLLASAQRADRAGQNGTSPRMMSLWPERRGRR